MKLMLEKNDVWNQNPSRTLKTGVKVVPIRPKKRIKLDRKDLEISAVKGRGKGGQKINRAKIQAVVKHVPTGKTATYFHGGRENTLASNTENAIEILEQMLQDE